MPTPETAPAEHRFVLPSADDPAVDDQVCRLAQSLAAVPDHETVRLEIPGAGDPLPVPPELLRALRILADCLASGLAASINPHDTVLTLGQAADLLGVSRSTVRAMADNGELVTTSQGTLDVVGLPDLLAAQGRLRSPRRVLRPVEAAAS